MPTVIRRQNNSARRIFSFALHLPTIQYQFIQTSIFDPTGFITSDQGKTIALTGLPLTGRLITSSNYYKGNRLLAEYDIRIQSPQKGTGVDRLKINIAIFLELLHHSRMLSVLVGYFFVINLVFITFAIFVIAFMKRFLSKRVEWMFFQIFLLK